MKEDFLDSAEQILSFRQHRDSLVKKMVITLIPTLAVYDTQTFSEHYSHKAMGHLLTQLEKPNERSFGKSSSPLRRPILILSSVHCYWAHCHCRRQRDEAILRTRDEPNQAWSPDARVLDHHSQGFTILISRQEKERTIRRADFPMCWDVGVRSWPKPDETAA